ncbi:MAG: crossover junction endodeoxyribonuclease RuvC [Candidatus Levyibacteriota bacterium]
MRILGIDPGSGRMGWGVIDQGAEESVIYLGHGCVVTEQIDSMPVRLLSLHKDLEIVIKQYLPECIVVEQLFFGINARTAMAVRQARGVVMLACAQYEAPFFEYTPIAVKHLLSGSGKTDKKEMQKVVRRILSKDKRTLMFSAKDKSFDDAADALAIAIHHAWKISGKAVTVLEAAAVIKKEAAVKLSAKKKAARTAKSEAKKKRTALKKTKAGKTR